jgi:hypothetical protein
MHDTKQKPPTAKRSFLLAFKIGLFAWTGVFTLLFHFSQMDFWAKIFAVLFAYSIVSIALRLGWTVPCIIAGTICGAGLDPAVKSGTLERQMRETATKLYIGIAIGLVIGLSSEFNAKHLTTGSDSDDSTDKSAP